MFDTDSDHGHIVRGNRQRDAAMFHKQWYDYPLCPQGQIHEFHTDSEMHRVVSWDQANIWYRVGSEFSRADVFTAPSTLHAEFCIERDCTQGHLLCTQSCAEWASKAEHGGVDENCMRAAAWYYCGVWHAYDGCV